MISPSEATKNYHINNDNINVGLYWIVTKYVNKQLQIKCILNNEWMNEWRQIKMMPQEEYWNKYQSLHDRNKE